MEEKHLTDFDGVGGWKEPIDLRKLILYSRLRILIFEFMSNIIFVKICTSYFYLKNETPPPLNPSPSPDVPSSTGAWAWLVDLERTCGLVVGSCIGGMLHGPPMCPQERTHDAWLNSPLFSNGLTPNIPLSRGFDIIVLLLFVSIFVFYL